MPSHPDRVRRNYEPTTLKSVRAGLVQWVNSDETNGIDVVLKAIEDLDYLIRVQNATR